jgi:two-component system chemotaxis response regulator CheY
MSIDKNIGILLVDDMEPVRRSVKSILKQAGFINIAEAENGTVALRKLKDDYNVKLVLTDWNMPTMNGITFLRLIRADADLRKIPVIMVTAETEEDHVAEAIKAGINDYILKPFTAEVLLDKIDRIFQRLNNC